MDKVMPMLRRYKRISEHLAFSFIIFILFLISASCSSRREAIKTNIETSVKEEMESFLNNFNRKTDASIDVSLLDGKIIITEIEFDTSSKDSVKPEKKRTVTEIDFIKKDSSKADIRIINKINNDVIEKKDSASVVENESDIDDDGPSALKYVYRILIVAVILSLVIFLIRRFKS